MLAKIPKVFVVTLIAIIVIVASIVATVFGANYMRGNDLSLGDIFSLKAFSLDKNVKKQNFDLFAGHSACENTIREKAEGKIISLTSDDRAAKVNSYANTNILTFKADIVPANERFLSEHHSTREYDIKCATSIDSNVVVSLSILPAEEL